MGGRANVLGGRANIHGWSCKGRGVVQTSRGGRAKVEGSSCKGRGVVVQRSRGGRAKVEGWPCNRPGAHQGCPRRLPPGPARAPTYKTALLEHFAENAWGTPGALLGHFWGTFGALLEHFRAPTYKTALPSTSPPPTPRTTQHCSTPARPLLDPCSTPALPLRSGRRCQATR